MIAVQVIRGADGARQWPFCFGPPPVFTHNKNANRRQAFQRAVPFQLTIKEMKQFFIVIESSRGTKIYVTKLGFPDCERGMIPGSKNQNRSFSGLIASTFGGHQPK